MSGKLIGQNIRIMGLKLKGSQFAAILRLATIVINCGDKSDSMKKTEELSRVSISFGIKDEVLRQTINLSMSMKPSEIDSEIRSLGEKEKKWLSAFLGRLIDVGEKYSENEMFAWKTIREEYNLPDMEIKEARRIISDCLKYGDFS